MKRTFVAVMVLGAAMGALVAGVVSALIGNAGVALIMVLISTAIGNTLMLFQAVMREACPSWDETVSLDEVWESARPKPAERVSQTQEHRIELQFGTPEQADLAFASLRQVIEQLPVAKSDKEPGHV